jgi:NADH-quinone oxidoreductase subunit E
MLTAEEKKEIEAEFPRYEKKQAVCIEALKIVQHHRGWVSDESLIEIAEFLEMAPAEVSCWIMGYERMMQHLQERLGIGLGETTADGIFTLLPIACLGACDQAPAMMIDDELYGNLDEDKIDEILASYTKSGT